MVRFLEAQGFVVKRIRGSHHFLENGRLRTVVPIHAAQDLRIGTVRAILRDVEMSPAMFMELLGE